VGIVKELHTVFCALIVSRILYAVPAWGGFLTADLIGKIDGLYMCRPKAIWWGYTGNLTLLSELLYDADMKLFRSMLHSTHYIHQLLPHIEVYANETPHFSLRFCSPLLPLYNLYKHSFVLRRIFGGAY